MYKGPLKRIRKRDLKRVDSTFDFDGQYTVSDAVMWITDPATSITEECALCVGPGDSLQLNVKVRLLGDLRGPLGDTVDCVLIPAHYLKSLYYLDERAV